jgi:hypothetical protein
MCGRLGYVPSMQRKLLWTLLYHLLGVLSMRIHDALNKDLDRALLSLVVSMPNTYQVVV